MAKTIMFIPLQTMIPLAPSLRALFLHNRSLAKEQAPQTNSLATPTDKAYVTLGVVGQLFGLLMIFHVHCTGVRLDADA